MPRADTRRRFWIHLNERQCRALMRGAVSPALRREFYDLLYGWTKFIRPELLSTTEHSCPRKHKRTRSRALWSVRR